jgi:hypothetical protein
MWDLPIDVDIDGEKHPIRNKCDYRVVLDVICALRDNDLTNEEKVRCALYIFYEDASKIRNLNTAVKEMFRIIGNNDEEDDVHTEHKPPLMDWEHDFPQIAPPVSRVLGYDVRTPDKYTHWYSFIGGYMEIGECTFSTIVSIRNKRSKGKKLEKWELDFLREHRKMVDLPQRLSSEEQELLNSEW